MISFAVFVFGLAVGSFLNAFIYRLERGESVLHGRSFCPRCNHNLAWYDLIPILSFVILRGRCRYCQQKISLQYPLVELTTGFLFLALLNTLTELRFLYVSYLWAMAASLIVICVYDLKHFLIPDTILFFAVGMAAFWRIFEFLNFDILNLVQPILAGLGASVFFLVLYLVSKGKWIGFGDVKLAFLLGLFLGWPLILVALFSAFSIGGGLGLLLIAVKKKGFKSEVPFAPFLIMGSAIAFFFGPDVIHWYLGLFLV